jgi:2-polyprenyl-3-methyl-5-hydroxy-6-metoxy-1,4-benzoquinol methylase
VNPDNIALQRRLDGYSFYHCLELNPEVTTKGYEEFRAIQAPVTRALGSLPLAGKRVLDVGCRDGLFSLQAERLGASEVIAIDNELSSGTVEVVLPYLRSGVQMFGLNLYDLTPDKFGKFDIVVFAGVLYHLRYPMWGLKRIRDVLNPHGWLLIETAVFVGHDDLPLLYCPIDDESPYEPTSVSFFNVKGLTDTLSSIGIRVQAVTLLGPDRQTDRATLTCKFLPETVHKNQSAFWEGTHTLHADLPRGDALRAIRERSEILYRRHPRA